MFRRLALLLTFLCLLPTARAQSPSLDYWSFLRAIKANENGSIFVDRIVCVFMPQEVMMTGAANEQPHLYLTLVQGGNTLHRIPFSLKPYDSVFSATGAWGAPPIFSIESSGDYEIHAELDGKVISTMPFKAELLGGDDPFAPDKKLKVSGPWSQLATLEAEGPASPDAKLKATLWQRSSNRENQTLKVEMHFRGQMIFESNTGGFVTPGNPEKLVFDLKFPKAAGADWVKLSDMTKQEGVYELLLLRKGQVESRFPYSVKGGKIEAHPRSSLGYEPHTDYLCSRSPATRNLNVPEAVEIYWSQLGTGPAASAAVMASAGPTAADFERWTVKGSFDPARKFELVHTNATARMDTCIAAGDGVIAFGTGGYNGVAYLKEGDTDSRSIPEGQTFRAGFQRVCGKKIVLVNGSEIAIFDTESEQLTKIPAEEITLGLPVKVDNESNPIATSGYLVATINDASEVTDRRVVKIIDLSGPTPVITSMANLDFQAKEATAIAVDAKTGLVAVSSLRKAAMYTGYISQDGALKKHDLTGSDSVETAPLVASGGRVAYRDDDGQSKFRILDPAGQLLTLTTIGPNKWGYDMLGDNYAFAVDQSDGSSYAYVTGKYPGNPAPAPGLGENMKGGNGKLGMGQSSALTPDGTLFIAGTGKGGLGSGEFLMALWEGKWHEFTGADGKALAAGDVTLGQGMVAFRTGERNNATISYAKFGATVSR